MYETGESFLTYLAGTELYYVYIYINVCPVDSFLIDSRLACAVYNDWAGRDETIYTREAVAMATTTHQYTYIYRNWPKSYLAISFSFQSIMLYAGPSVQHEKCPGASQKTSFRLLFSLLQ
jgi:hypothetical protein